jgi:XTP/dITP diphosphohydrolase
MEKILLATNNKNKKKEIKEILKGINYKILSGDELNLNIIIEESGNTYEENALLKARKYAEKSNYLTISEDSGLEIDYLQGKPGIYSARFVKGTDQDRYLKILNVMHGIPSSKRRAKFICVAGLYDPLLSRFYSFRGESDGYITTKPIGKKGFGYDPIFFNNKLGKTNAQASVEEKNKYSHRTEAFKQLKFFLNTYR